jgi:hypothetical protein
MSYLNLWEVRCNDTASYEEFWGTDTVPTVCPTDGSSNINTSATYIKTRTLLGTTRNVTFADTPVTAGGETFIIADTSGGNIQINLPSISSAGTKVYYIEKSTNDTNTVTIHPDGSDTIEGVAADVVLPTTGNHLVSGSTNIRCIAYGAQVDNNDWNDRIPQIISTPKLASGINIGLSGVGVYSATVGSQLQFKNVVSAGNVVVTDNMSTDTVDVSIPNSTTAITGAIRIATQAETDSGTATDIAISPLTMGVYVAANGGSTNMANTGVGAGVFSAKDGSTGWFRSLTGTNAHTQVVQNADDISFTVPFSSMSATGAIRIATQAEVDSGNLGNVAISPTGLASWVLGDLAIPRYEIEFTDAIAGFSSTTDVVMSGPMTITNPDAGTYLVSFSFSAAASTNNNSLIISIYVGGVQNAASERESANNKPVIAATQAIISVNGSQDIDIRWRVSANAASSPGPRILSALRIAP